MDYVLQARIHDSVVATLRQLGVACPRLDETHMRIMSKDGGYAGHVLQCEQIRVVFSADGRVIQFFGPGGVLLKQIDIRQIAA